MGLKEFDCFIFDMDGTVSDTNRLIYDSFNYIARKYRGREYSEGEITKMFGPPEEDALLAVVGKDVIDRAMADYLAFYRSQHRTLARLHAGIEDALARLKKRGKKIALFTGKGKHTTTISLEEFGIGRYFDFVVTGNDVLNHKPSGDGIRKILEHFHVHEERALMVGDSVGDVKAAHDAHVAVAAVLWDSYSKDQVMRMKSDYLFHDVQEFSRWLERLP